MPYSVLIQSNAIKVIIKCSWAGPEAAFAAKSLDLAAWAASKRLGINYTTKDLKKTIGNLQLANIL